MLHVTATATADGIVITIGDQESIVSWDDALSLNLLRESGADIDAILKLESRFFEIVRSIRAVRENLG